MNDFKKSLTPPFARIDSERDPRDALIDTLTIQLANAVRVVRQQSVRLAQFELDHIKAGGLLTETSRDTP